MAEGSDDGLKPSDPHTCCSSDGKACAVQGNTGQQASEPKQESEPCLQEHTEPVAQHNTISWTHIAPVPQESKPALRFDPIPKVSPPVSLFDSLVLTCQLCIETCMPWSQVAFHHTCV